MLDTDGNVVVQYKYDAWGNHLVLDANGNPHIGHLNPFRYRGYIYDTQTGLYYLQSRYYDPVTGRFISPDAVEYLDPESIGGLNLYAYCGNNPVMYSDPTGHAWWEWLIAGTIVAGLIVGAIFTGGLLSAALVGAAIGGGISLASQAITTGELNLVQFALDVGVGAITGLVGASSVTRGVATIIGVLVGGGSNIVAQLISGASFGEINWWKVGLSAAIGGAASFISGAGSGNIKAVNSTTKVTKATNAVNKVLGRMNTGYYSSARYAQAALTNVSNRLGKAFAKQQLSMFIGAMICYGTSTAINNFVMELF